MSNYFTAVVNNQYFYTLPICNLMPQNSGSSVGGVIGNVASTNNFPSGGIVIPDYIKKLDIDYISFGANPAGSTILPSQLVVCQIVYDTGVLSSSPFYVINASGTSVSLTDTTEYDVEIRVRNGELLPIDIKSIKRIQVSTSSSDTSRLAYPTNITLWKRFLKSDSNNIKSFMVDNKLPSGSNPTTP